MRKEHWRALRRDQALYWLMLPGILFYIVFKYVPMYGVLISFQNYSIGKGIWGSEWVGFKHFIDFFTRTPDAWQLIRNTLLLNVYELLFAFPAPILLALLLNELRVVLFRRFIQTVSYLPHFLSTVVIVGMVVNFLSPSSGIVNHVLVMLGIEPIMFMAEPGWFRTIYVASEIWQTLGWGTILYLAAIAGVDPTLYEAARMDGANRFQQIRHITFVGMLPVVIILLVLNLGKMMEIGYQKIILLYNPTLYDTADVINTFVYRRGLINADFSFAAAVGLFQAVIGFVLVVAANKLARKTAHGSLW
ncbi:ABC transporter permease [Paenibacillus sabuli]|nr:ABC transporter permease subunit [Paenibacillus sabuli]